MSLISMVSKLNVRFLPGAAVKFGNTTYYLAGQTSKPRPPGHASGTSSPQWLDTLRVAASEKAATDYAKASPSGEDPSCTGSSKQVQLLLVPGDKKLGEVDVLVTAGVYMFRDAGKPIHAAIELKARKSSSPFDPTGAGSSGDAKAWRVMSAFCESLLGNFPDQRPGSQPAARTKG